MWAIYYCCRLEGQVREMQDKEKRLEHGTTEVTAIAQSQAKELNDLRARSKELQATIDTFVSQ